MKQTQNIKKYAAGAAAGAVIVAAAFGAYNLNVTDSMESDFSQKLASLQEANAAELSEVGSAFADKYNAQEASHAEELVSINITPEIQFKTIYEQVNVTNPVNDALVEFAQDNVDEDVTVAYVIAEMDGRFEAEAFIRENFYYILDDADEVDSTLDNFRKSEISIKRIDNDIEVSHQDYEDKDFELTFEVKIKGKESGEDSEYFDYEVTVPFVSGHMDEEDITVELQ